MAEVQSNDGLVRWKPDSLKSLLAEVAGLRRHVAELTGDEHDLVRTQARLQTLLHRATDAIIQFDHDRRINGFNPTAEKIFGYPEDAMIGQGGDLLFDLPPQFAGDVPGYLLEYARTTSNQYEQPLIGIRNDGTPIMLEVSVADVTATDAVVFGGLHLAGNGRETEGRACLCLLRDITQRKQLDEELRLHRDHLERLVAEQVREIRLAKEEAEAANRVKSELLAKISHELRTPMHAILSYSEFGLKKFESAPPEKLAQYFSRINSAGSRLLNMIDGLLSLAKAEVGPEVYEMRSGDLHDLIIAIVHEYEVLAEHRGVSLLLDLRLPDPDAVFDQQRMGHVIRNLIANAIKFSPRGGRVQITTEAATVSTAHGSADAVRVLVIDDGDGIRENELDRIFEKFVRGTRHQGDGQGTGLGLAISREVVQAHGGWLAARNMPAGGACFELVFPHDVQKRVCGLS